MDLANISEVGISEITAYIRIILQIVVQAYVSEIILSLITYYKNSTKYRKSLYSKKLKEYAQIQRISILNIIILSNKTYYSYEDEELILKYFQFYFLY